MPLSDCLCHKMRQLLLTVLMIGSFRGLKVRANSFHGDQEESPHHDDGLTGFQKQENLARRSLSQTEMIHKLTQELESLSSKTVDLEHHVTQVQQENAGLRSRCSRQRRSVNQPETPSLSSGPSDADTDNMHLNLIPRGLHDSSARRPRALSQTELIHQLTQQLETISGRNVELEQQVKHLQQDNAALKARCSSTTSTSHSSVVPLSGWIRVQRFDMAPQPLHWPGSAHLTFHVNVTHDVKENIIVDITLFKMLLGKATSIPCFSIRDKYFGSCRYNNVCDAMAAFFPHGNCPDIFSQNGLPCSCPFTLPQGDIIINNEQITLPGDAARWSWLETAEYFVRVVLWERGVAKKRGCLEYFPYIQVDH